MGILDGSGRFTGGYWAGLPAAVIFLTCVEVWVVGTLSVLDSLFSMFVTSAMLLFFFTYMEEKPGKRTAFAALFGTFCGLAFLTKGFLAFALPAAAIIPFMIWERRFIAMIKISWVPIVTAILVVLPWAVTIHFKEPDFWHYFFWVEHIKRFMSDHPQHPEAFWYFVPVILGGVLPWTAVLPAVFSGFRKIDHKKPHVRFALCWFLFPFLFFSMSHGKLATYILPCYPPLAILISLGLSRYFQDGSKRAFDRGALCLAILLAMVAAVLAAGQITGISGLGPYGPEETWKWVWGVSGLLLWSMLLAISCRNTALWKKLGLFCTAPLLFMFCASFLLPDQVKEKKAPGDFLMRNAHRIKSDTIIVANNIPRSVCWFYRRNDVLILNGSGELNYGLGYRDSKNRFLNAENLRNLIRGPRNQEVVLIIKANKCADYRQVLPEPVFEDSNGVYIFAAF